MTEPGPVELRFAVDGRETPLVYPDSIHVQPVEDLAVDISGPGVLTTLVVPLGEARTWAGELFTAVAVAYREATGDPHALSDLELASLPAADGYDPGPGLLVAGDDDQPARVRYHISLDIDGLCLSTTALRAELVDTLTGRFNVTRIGVSPGEPRAGRIH
jgi:hypothetical protein